MLVTTRAPLAEEIAAGDSPADRAPQPEADMVDHPMILQVNVPLLAAKQRRSDPIRGTFDGVFGIGTCDPVTD